MNTFSDSAVSSEPPMPPHELRSIVAGNATEQEFLIGGQRHLSLFLDLYEKHATNRRARPRVLDFGCGCGRLSRHFSKYRQFDASACDLNPDHVVWCRTHLPHVRTVRNGPAPPLPFGDASFDCVYALSVITHLREEMSLSWIIDISRVLAPGGIAIVTTHGYPALDMMLASPPHREMMAIPLERTQLMRKELPMIGYSYVAYAAPVVQTANVGIDYGNSFTDPAYAQTTWAPFLQPLGHMAGALDGWQDVFVLQRAARAPSTSMWRALVASSSRLLNRLPGSRRTGGS